jgi:hypothetical protein
MSDMTSEGHISRIVEPTERLVMIVGSYGSGKTEVSVNLTIGLAQQGVKIQIADLDIVNPYFRCREAQLLMEQHSVRVVVPPGNLRDSDLPIILPEIKGMLTPPEGTLTIFDVGGDDVGARSLARFRPFIQEGSYQLWQVINPKRPFTDTLEGCLQMQAAIEKSSRLKVTGLLVNSHLIDQTVPGTVLEGWDLAKKIEAETALPIRCVAVMDELAEAPELSVIDAPVLRLQRHMLPPWLSEKKADGRKSDETEGQHAARTVPLGKPTPEKFLKSEGDQNG